MVLEREVHNMRKTMSKNNWEKTIVLEGREFRIKFWYDSWDLFYTSIEEKISVKPSFFNKKGYYFEKVVFDYWIDEIEQNPIKLALTKIKRFLQDEKELNKLEEMLDKFCQ
jgi:hypothetical protein